MNSRKLWHEIDLLTRVGVGIAPIAAELARLLRSLIGADAAAIFWLDDKGMPEGFFHEDSPAAVQDLFLNEFERLFVGPKEINVFALANRRDRNIGHLLRPDASYFRSNTYNLLVRASGHHHSLDLRVDIGGRGRAVVLLFRNHKVPFDDAEADRLQRVSPYLQRAMERLLPIDEWSARTDQTGYLLLDESGRRIAMVDAEAMAILRTAGLPGVGVRESRIETPPYFIRSLDVHSGRRVRLPIPGGALEASARLLRASDSASGSILVCLSRVRPRPVEIVQRVMSLKLSPLQREIALLAGLGHPRSDCSNLVGVSHEALKKHLRAILSETATRDWDSLASFLGG